MTDLVELTRPFGRKVIGRRAFRAMRRAGHIDKRGRLINPSGSGLSAALACMLAFGDQERRLAEGAQERFRTAAWRPKR